MLSNRVISSRFSLLTHHRNHSFEWISEPKDVLFNKWQLENRRAMDSLLLQPSRLAGAWLWLSISSELGVWHLQPFRQSEYVRLLGGYPHVSQVACNNRIRLLSNPSVIVVELIFRSNAVASTRSLQEGILSNRKWDDFRRDNKFNEQTRVLLFLVLGLGTWGDPMTNETEIEAKRCKEAKYSNEQC